MILQDFLNEVVAERAHCPSTPILRHLDPVALRSVLTLGEVYELIDRDCLPMAHVALLADHKPVDPRVYEDGLMPRRGYVRRHLDDGGTVSLRSLERLKPAIAGLYDTLRRETGCDVHINGYLTPPGCQGLRYHHDPYATLILQLHGSKAWPTHSPWAVNPTVEFGSHRHVGFTPEQRAFLATTDPENIYTLHPGDFLWLPRGYIHAPYTQGEEPSLHLTIALKERTYWWAADLVAQRVLAEAMSDPEMRAGIAPAEVLDCPERVVDEARRYLVGALTFLDAPGVTQALRRAAVGGSVAGPTMTEV